MATPYTPLLYHSNYGRGGSDLKTLFEHLHRHGLKSCGLVDKTFFGLHDFIRHAREYAVKPIIGTQLPLPGDKGSRSYLLIKNAQGYANLCKIVTGMSFDRITAGAVEEHAAGLILLTNSLKLLRELGPAFPDRFYLLLPGRAVIDHAFPAVAANEIFYVTKPDKELYRLMCAIKNNRYENTPILPNCLLDNERFGRIFAEYPAAIRNNIRLAEMCDYAPENKGWIFPSSTRDLHSMIEQKIKNLTAREKERLDHEYGIIMNTGFAPYFSLVYHLKEFALGKGIGMNVRGSAASSFILYKLGLSVIDPIKNNLPFERFLNPRRAEPPDIDVDVEFNERGRLIREIYQEFGGDRVAHISVTDRFKRRSSFRETARACGITPRELKTIANHLEEDTIRQIHDLSARITGYPHYFSCHPSGIVITPKPICDYVPLHPSPAGQITHLDKDGVEMIGLVKIDILGVRGFPALYLSRDRIRFDDPAVYDFVGRAETMGCFQIESPMVRFMLKRIKPRTTMDIANAIAIIRPGPAQGGMKERFLKRIRGEERVDYPHQRLKDALAETLGIPVYQEQILQIAHDFADFSLSDGDMLRRAMTKARSPEKMKEIEEVFFAKAAGMGYEPPEITPVWERIKAFSSFGFNKAHSITYATLAYLSAYQKYYEPLKFFCQVINHKGGYYPTIAYINEARRRGIRIMAPDVNESAARFTARGPSLLAGLDEIRELSTETIRRTVSMRPFQGAQDFFYRVRPSIEEGIALIKSGSLDRFNLTWPELYFFLLDSKVVKQPIPNFARKAPKLHDFSRQVKVMEQLQTMEFIPACHILQAFYSQRQMHIAGLRERTRARLISSLITRRTIRTRNNRLMSFLTVDDETGILEVVIFPDRYDPNRVGPIMEIAGTMQEDSLVADDYKAMPVFCPEGTAGIDPGRPAGRMPFY